MTRRKLLVGLLGAGTFLSCGARTAVAQKATERYVPIGRSPGLSGRATIVGRIETVDPRGRSVAIAGTIGTWRAKITERTAIWLDRSKLGEPNSTGTFADLAQGRTVEAKPEAPERMAAGGPVEWIKVQIPASR